MQRPGFGAHFSQLGRVQRIANVVLDASRKGLHVGAGIGEPREFLHALVHELCQRILKKIDEINQLPVIHRWNAFEALQQRDTV